MPRRREIPKREIPADPLYQSPLVTKFISCVMHDGKRSTAQRIVYKSFELVAGRLIPRYSTTKPISGSYEIVAR